MAKCEICGKGEDVIEVRGEPVCAKCIREHGEDGALREIERRRDADPRGGRTQEVTGRGVRPRWRVDALHVLCAADAGLHVSEASRRACRSAGSVSV